MDKSKPTTKALQAWQSELRRLEAKLKDWEEVLAERERILDAQEEIFQHAMDGAPDEVVQRYADLAEQHDQHGGIAELENDEDEIECGCTAEDAMAGCDCDGCESWRAGREKVKAMMAKGKPQPKGDEIAWLESLWKLEDKRPQN